MTQTTGKWVRGVVLPIVMVGIGIIIRRAINPILGEDGPFLLLLAAITASAYFGGMVGGLLASFISVFAAAFLFFEPKFSIAIRDLSSQVQLFVFTLEGVVITSLCEALRRARLRAEVSAEEARNLQRQVSDAADREQKRIGQDLHDDLGQYLTGVALAGELIARRMEKDGSAHTDQCRKLVHMVNDAVNRTRQLARGLSPMAVDPESLPLLLAELQERSAELSGRDVTFEPTGDAPSLPSETVLHMYRIAQEGVSNALKHSHATRIDIRLHTDDDHVLMEIADNGQGYTERRNSGMGLRVMEFRARTIGATLKINGSDGTTITCDLPLPEEKGLTGSADVTGVKA